MTPACHNRPPFTDPNAGWVQTGWLIGPAEGLVRSIYRYRWPWFTDRCATWDGTGIGPNGEPYPVAHGFDCEGCRWKPENTTEGIK